MSWWSEGKLKKDKAIEKLQLNEDKVAAKKTRKNRICKATKGEHMFDVPKPYKMFDGKIVWFTLCCACGKKGNTLYVPNDSLFSSYKFLCPLHGLFYRDEKTCPACRVGLGEFKFTE
jgi:hypothetical protein